MTAVARSFLALTAQAKPSQVPHASQAPDVGRDPIDGEREPERREAELASGAGDALGDGREVGGWERVGLAPPRLGGVLAGHARHAEDALRDRVVGLQVGVPGASARRSRPRSHGPPRSPARGSGERRP